MLEKYTTFQSIPKFTDPGHYAVDYPLHRLVKFVENEIATQGLQLNPEFQRGHVWKKHQQVAYIEFLLRGGSTGRDIYFNCPSWHNPVPAGAYNDYVCVDGLQRVTAITRFINNDIKVFGSYYKEFTDRLNSVKDTIRVHVNCLKTYQEVLTWYLEMNSGGTPHTNKELQRVQALLDACQQKGAVSNAQPSQV